MYQPHLELWFKKPLKDPTAPPVVLLLNWVKCYLSKGTKTIPVLQMVQEQLWIYSGYALDRPIFQEWEGVSGDLRMAESKCPCRLTDFVGASRAFMAGRQVLGVVYTYICTVYIYICCILFTCEWSDAWTERILRWALIGGWAVTHYQLTMFQHEGNSFSHLPLSCLFWMLLFEPCWESIIAPPGL